MRTLTILCLTLSLTLLTLPVSALPLVDALGMVESGGRDCVVGDGGRARGRWQMWRGTWDDTSHRRRQRGLETWTWMEGSADPAIARVYAQDHLDWLASQLRKHHTTPTPQRLVASWQLGFTGFKRRGFDVRRCPAHVRRAVSKVVALL